MKVKIGAQIILEITNHSNGLDFKAYVKESGKHRKLVREGVKKTVEQIGKELDEIIER